ncbi:MAG: beta-N-acetylglucosaminidase domain-containing protein [Oscillospiraceae bacterium]|nr:beta-N-acetylglucosaminidase domain-containing protein [Oscillospiraceae bacterium]
MKSRMKKWLSLLLSAVLVFSNVQFVNAAPRDAERTYDIYPVVQEITYDGTAFSLGDRVHVVYETGIDQATRDYLAQVLTDNGIAMDVVSEPVAGEANLLLGIDGSGERADAHENTLTRKTADLYDRYDGYLLEAKEKQITIVGGDSDGIFCGVATLKMMLSSFEDDILPGALIEDYASIEYRGFIEGFYGGWDYETRAELMEFARDVKMNMYVYASKTDAYHTSRWGDLYPDAEIERIEELVRIGQQTKCRYVWSVHLGSFFSGLNIANNPSLYEERYGRLVAKLTQLYNAGVRKFDILNDDFGSGSHADVVTVLNRLTEEFIVPMGCEPITYCPQGYNRSWSGNGAELDALKHLDDSIILYWTGDDVNSPITQSTVDYVANRTGQPVSFWLNYPVNEHAKSGMFLGDITHYARDGVTGLKAAVSNPSRFGQSNKVALFQLACLFWNNSDYSSYAQEIWLDSFNYLEPGVEEAYRTIGRNVSNCPGSSRVAAGFPESEYIKEHLDALSAAVNNGDPIADLDYTGELLTEFSHIRHAVQTFRKNCKNTDLVSELEPWLKSLESVTLAAQAAVNSIIALENGDNAEAWTFFTAASNGLQNWDANLTCDDPTVTNKALAGSKRLQPFANQMVKYVEKTLTPQFDPNYSGFDLYAVLGGQKQTMDDNARKMFDGDEGTYAQWNVIQRKDDYFGVDLGVVKTVTDISIVQANSDTHHDYFHKAVLEYSADGRTWTQLGDRYNDTYRIELDGLNIQARYVRLRLAEMGTATKPDYWTHVREFTVNRAKPDGDRVYTNVESYARQPLTIEGRELSLADLKGVTLNAGEYIGIKFRNLALVSSITLEGTGLEGLTLAHSTNAAQWEEDLSGTTAVKYVRLYNGTGARVTFDLAKLGVTVESAKADPKFLETNLTNGLKEGTWANVFDGQESTYAWTNEGQSTGDYITFDLGGTIDLYDVTIVTADGNPRLYNAEIQISANKSDWQTIATVVNDNSVFEVPYRYVRANAQGAEARYLRIYFTGNTGYYFKLHEIFLNTTVEDSTETAEITASFGENIGNAIDGNLATLFSGTADSGDWIAYRFTESTRFNAISILQDPANISNAVVSVLKEEGYVQIGTLDESAKKFTLDSSEDIYGLKLTFDKETDISLYEIYLDAVKGDDIGEYVDPIIIETREDITEPANLAPGKAITVSGTSDGNKDNVNDGDTSTKWDSDFIKGSNARDNSWIYIDLGADKTSIFDELTMHYFNKIYPTLMYIQVSNDAANWHEISELTRAHNGQTHPIVTETFDTAYAARYIRLFFEELNSAAAGNGVGLTEWEINGIALADVSLKAVSFIDGIQKELNEELTEAELPQFVMVILDHAVAGEIEVMAPVTWDLSAYNGGANGVYEIVGTLDLPATVHAADRTVTVTVTVGSAHEHSYEAVVTAPTCTEGGYTTYLCECGESYIADETEALGHAWKGLECTRCGEKRENPFTDVKEKDFFFDPVLWAVEKGVTTGATETTFNPNGKCQRAAVVTFLWRAAGSPEPTITENPFTDVEEKDFFYKAVLWAVEKNITTGTSATEFSPMKECNRAQVVTFLYRAMGEPEVTSTNNPFADVKADAWYGPAVLWAVENGITNGMSANEFGVNSTCNRAQVVTFLYRTYNK